VPDNIRNSLTLPSSSTGAPRRPSEVEKAAALHKIMREKPDKEVSYYDNPTILSRLIESQHFSAALERLEKKGPTEASIWVCTKRESSGDGVDVGLEDGSTSLISGLTQSFSQVVHKEAYTFRALPIHMACSCLGQTAVAEKGLWTELERLIAYLAIVYPEGCGRRDLDGRLPLHEAIWHNASPSTVSALLMAAPEAVNEQDVHGRYPMALNEHRTGEHKDAVRKLLRLRRKYWDMAREEATLRFKHRNVPSADESITSTSVLAASIADEETLFTTASAFPFASASAKVENSTSHDNDNDQRRNQYKATNVTQSGREPIQPISWSQLEDRAKLAEQKLEQVNEANYILTKQVIELKAANKEVQDKLDRYTKTDLGRQVKRLETEKEDLTWLVQQLQGILLRNGIALDPEEANFVNPPREVKAVAGGGGKESAKNVVENVNKPPTDNAKSSSSDERQQQQQQPQEQQQQQQQQRQQQQQQQQQQKEQKEQKEKVQQQVEASEAENQQHQSLKPAVAAKAATTTHKHSVLETNERLGNGFVLNQKPPPVASASAQSAPASQINKYARHDDDNENESESEHDGNSCSIGPYSFGSGSQQSRLEYDMQVLEEMNERVRQLVLSESATNYQGQSLYPQFAARPKVDVQQQHQQQQRSCLKEPPASTPQQGGLEEENEMDKKPQAKPSVVSQKDPPQSAAATHVEDCENNTTINKKQQATTVADFDVTCSNDSQSSFPISTIEEEESEEGMEQSALKPTDATSSSGDSSGKSHDGISIASVDQDGAEDINDETVSCSNQKEVDDADMDDLDSVLAEAVKLNGGKGLSPDILRLWRETTTSSYGLSNISLPSMLEEHLQQQQGLNGGKGLSPEMLRWWRETSAASFDVSAVSLPNMFEQQQQQDEASAGSSSTDTRENKSPPHKKKSPATASPTSSPSLVGETLGTTSAMMCQSQNNHVTCNVKSNTDYCMNTDKAAAAAAPHASSGHAKSSNINQRSLFCGAAAKKPPSLDDMTVFTDDMSQLFSRAAKIYTEGRGSDDGAAST
jgi:hypothetical protein